VINKLIGRCKRTYADFTSFFSGPDAQARAAITQMDQIWDAEILTGLLQGTVTLPAVKLKDLMNEWGANRLAINQVTVAPDGRLVVEGNGPDGTVWETSLQIQQLCYGEWEAQLQLSFLPGAEAWQEPVAVALAQALFGAVLGPAAADGIYAEAVKGEVKVFVDPGSFFCKREDLAIFGQPIADNLHIKDIRFAAGEVRLLARLEMPDNISSLLNFLAPMVRKQHG